MVPVAAQAPVTFKANANLVIIDVSAKDKGGMPVEGLKADDFIVLEDGKPQKISVFEYQRISSKPEPLKEVTLDDQFAAAGGAEDNDHVRDAGADSVSRQAADGVLLRLFLDADLRTSCARRTARSST